MSYHQTYKGSFTFADAHCLEAGLDAFFDEAPDADEKSSLDLDDLELNGLTLTVDWKGSAAASSSFGSQAALGRLGEHARSGHALSTFEGDDGATKIRAGKRRSPAGLPARHHRWDIYFACRSDDADRLRELAAQGVSLDVRFPQIFWWRDLGPLHVAARAGASKAVAALLELGIPADALGGDAAPIHLAKTAEVASLLLAAGADRDRLDGNHSPLSYALDHERFDAARVLVEAGAKVPDGAAALATLARCAQLDLLRTIVERDPVVAAAICDPAVIQSAVDGGEPVILDFLLQHGAALPEDFLERAVAADSLPLVELALRDPQARAKGGASNESAHPMCRAAGTGNLAILAALADAGISVAPAEPGKTSPLHRAADADNGTSAKTVAWLLSRGGFNDHRSGSGLTPLAEALAREDYDSAKLIYLAGASIDAISRDWIGQDRIDLLLKKAGKAKPVAAKTVAKAAKKSAAKSAVKRAAKRSKPAKKKRAAKPKKPAKKK